MSDISPKDGKDFTKPDSVNGSDKDDLSVAGHPDDNTTSQKPNGQGSSSSSSSSSSESSSSSDSSTSNSGSTSSSQSSQSSGSNSSSGNALTKLFNLNAIFDIRKSS